MNENEVHPPSRSAIIAMLCLLIVGGWIAYKAMHPTPFPIGPGWWEQAYVEISRDPASFIVALAVFFIGLNYLVQAIQEGIKTKTVDVLRQQRLSGTCPYCQTDIKAPPPMIEEEKVKQPQGFDCPSCARRILVKENAFAPMPEATKR